MAQGKVNVYNKNLGQGSIPGVEKKFIFLGVGDGTTNKGATLSLDSQSDLDVQLGETASELKTILAAAQLNGGPDWEAKAHIIDAADGNYDELFTIANAGVEAAVYTDAIELTQVAMEAHQTNTVQIKNTYKQPIFIIQVVEGINPATQTWAQYEAAVLAATSALACDAVLAVPHLFDNNADAGVLAGRLCRGDVSIADKPMRVMTGPTLGLGSRTVDSNGLAITDATLKALDGLRLSVPQTYVGKPGIYWGDANTFADPTSDYTVIENVRLANKVNRAIRANSINKIADRSINSTPSSMAFNTNDYMKILRSMSKTITFDGKTFPGECKTPEDGDITIVWTSRSKYVVYFKVRPYESAVEIEGNVFLDLSDPA